MELFSGQPIFKDKKKACGLLPTIYPNLSISQVNILRLLLDQQITIVSPSKRKSMEQVFLDLPKTKSAPLVLSMTLRFTIVAECDHS